MVIEKLHFTITYMIKKTGENAMEKLFKTFIGFGILCIVIIYIIFGPYLLIKNIGNVIQYHQDKNSVIEIPAVVTEIKDSVGSEGGTDYHVYVTYNHNKKAYTDVYWRQTGYEDKFPLGSTVTIKISENNPGKIFEGAFDNYFSLFFPLVFTIFGIYAAIATYLSIYNPDFGKKKEK